MWRVALLALMVLQSCAEVPASLCFSDEPCADGGSAGGRGGGTATGGGSTGGGGATGGGGGALGGGGGGGADGGVPLRFASLGIPDLWSAVQAALPSTQANPPTFAADETTTLAPAISLTSATCTEAFRGAVVLPDHRVLAIPFCVDRFAVIDAAARTATWVGPTFTPAADQGRWGGAVLGCDGRVYALPHRTPSVMRVTPEDDGGLTFVALPLSNATPHRLSGGVVARSCVAGFRIIAAGEDGLYALDPSEDAVTITNVGPRPSVAQGRTFVGVARIGDSKVVSIAPPPAGTDAGTLTLWVDSNDLTFTNDTNFISASLRFGVATETTSEALMLSEQGGAVYSARPNGTSRFERTLNSGRLRWPTTSLTGWVYAVGDQLMALSEDGSPDQALLADARAFNSGGLVLTPSGVLVSVPTTRSAITIYVPSGGPTLPAGVVLSPWFNKL